MPTPRTNYQALAKSAAVVLCLVFTLGCGLHKAKVAYEEGRYDDALTAYKDALRRDPNNLKAKIGYRRTAPLAAEVHLNLAKAALRAGREDVVRREVATAVVLDPSNAVAVDWMARIEEAAARIRDKEEAEESVDAMRIKGEGKAILPINPRSLEGMDLNFTRKTSLREIFLQLSKNSGVNIILHSSASQQDVQISVDLRGLPFQRILDTLMLQSDLFYKVMDPNTIMVFKKTPQNLQEFENKLIKTFYLSNAEVESVRQIFNALMPQLRVFIDKRLNALTIMSKQSDLAIAQRIVNQLDKAKAEVMVYLELLEVSQGATEAVGLLPTLSPSGSAGVYRLGATYDSGFNGSPNTSKGAVRLTKSNVQFLFPSLALDMLKSNSDGKLLASPNIRIVSGETGEVNIGDKVSTTQSQLGIPSANSTGAAASAASGLAGIATASTQYSYEDVGVKIKVKPRVHFNGDITIELESDIKTLKPGSDPGRPNLSQRVIKTSARLRDGETAVFGGLLKEEEQKTLQGIWGLTDIPVLGKLLGNTGATRAKTDVILTIRAVLVRKSDLGEEDFEAFDPDQAPQNKPFVPKPVKGAVKPPAAIPQAPQPVVPAPVAKPDLPPAAVQPAPAPVPQAPVPAPPVAVPVPEPQPAAPAPAAEAQPAAGATAEPSELVFFMDPISGTAPKGKAVRVTIYASGGKGLTDGAMELRVDPKLKVNAIAPGDFITSEGGSLSQAPGANGNLTVKFTRKAGAPDSGTLATLDLECMETGKATVLIQGGLYLVGANPISARVVNAMITVE